MTVNTIKISEMTDAGSLVGSEIVPGLDAGANVRYTTTLQFSPDWTTATRPVAPETVPTIGFNLDTFLFDYWDGTLWQTLETTGGTADILALLASHTAGEGASLIGLEDQGSVLNKTVQDFNEAAFIAQTDNNTLPNAQFLGDLATGILKNTTGTGVLSIAIPGTDYSVLTWNVITSDVNPISASNAYIVNHSSDVTCTLPATAAVGDTFYIGNTNLAGRAIIAQDAGQYIIYGSAVTTTGAGGSITAIDAGCFLQLTCIVADTVFMVGTGSIGNFTIV